MNKRFSTLLAAALVAGGLSANAADVKTHAERFQSVVPAEAVTMDEAQEGYYYHLGDANNYLGFVVTDDATFLRSYPIAQGDELYVNSMDSALWEPTITIANNAKSFKFTNKFNGEVLAVKFDAKDNTAVWVDAETEGAVSSFTFDNENHLICYSGTKKYALKVEAGKKAQFVEWKDADKSTYGTVKLFTPEQKLQSAKDLNAISNGSFKLKVLDVVTDKSADFLNGSELIAYDAKYGSMEKGVYLQIKNATKANTRDAGEGQQLAKDGKTALKNKHVFLVVDTVFNSGTAFNDSIGGRGLQIASDTITCQWEGNGASVDQTKSDLYDAGKYIVTKLPDATKKLSLDEGADLQVAKGRFAANYRFYIYKNVAKVGVEGFTVKVDSIPSIITKNSKYGTRGATDYYQGAVQDSVGYFAIARTGTGNPGLFTIVDSTTLSKGVTDTYATLSTADGKLATLEKGVYSIQVKGGNVIAAALIANNPDATDPAFVGLTKASELVPATQFAIEGRNGRYSVVNRENGASPFDQAKVYIYATSTAGEYTVSAKDKITNATKTYVITKLDVDTDNEYLGYKHFTKDEIANYIIKLKFNTAFGGDNLYVVKGANDRLAVADIDAADPIEFSLRPAATDTTDAGGKVTDKTVKYGDNTLERTAYHLHAVNDDATVLTYDPQSQVFKMVALDKSDDKKNDGKVGYAKKDSISMPVLFRLTVDNQYQLLLADTAYYDPKTVGSKLAANEPSHVAYYKVDSLRMGQLNVAGSGASVIMSDLNAVPAGYFTLELPDDAAFVDPIKATPSHNRIASARNTTLAISMNDSKQGVLKAETELKADAFVESDFSMFIDTANMDNQKGEKPLFYILTTRGLDAEAVADGQAMYMASKDGSSVEFIKAKQFGEAGRDSLLVYATKANEQDAKLKLSDNYATFAFASTSTKGEYKIQNVKNQKYLAQTNGILNLAGISPYSGLAFTVDAVEAPTANEGVEVSEVTVIAGEGQVTIAGAAGKKVVISNILGQVVANTVLTSDNAVIAAPQGVVVVAVEGEEAVKAIVK
ncbi:DUF6383 domain-containing protein [Parabacteroides hominis]|uniref:DUF6383 domain-containing protein n=1 Tax=Parabacteroides hominis TaxID=2763057 RepID=A0ABR7DLQ5_9BACT|nr:DUF6383 domain-containing protein [Parabacteroides hominis]MBC5631773.1 hypothetical protein [Parabacteroides hominis]